MDLPFTLKTGGCLKLCSIPEVYNSLRPIEFVLTHVAMIKYAYDDSELFMKKNLWTKFLLYYNVKVRCTKRSPCSRKGVDIGVMFGSFRCCIILICSHGSHLLVRKIFSSCYSVVLVYSYDLFYLLFS